MDDDYDYDYDYDYDHEYTRNNNVPAFGSWVCNDDLPFTQCFESVRQAGLLHYRNRDLYVTGDLYDNDVVTPAMIIVPRRTGKGVYPHIKKEKENAWVVCDFEYDYNYDYDAKEPPSPVSVATPPPPEQPRKHIKHKPIDEDLYKISPDLLPLKHRRKKWWSFASCMRPKTS